MPNLNRIDVKKTVDEYLRQQTWKVHENANQKFSYSSVSWRLAGETMTRYTLSQVYPKKVSNAHLRGDMHIHNLYMGITGYCCGWSMEEILTKGITVPGLVISAPAKHLNVALNQIVNFLGLVTNEWAGAQALNSLDTYLAPFIRHEKLKYREVKQAMQSFVYALNLPTRWGGQTPFTNITFDVKVPKDLADQPAIIGGKPQKTMFRSYQKEMDMINRAFIEVMLEGDSQGRAFTFPIPTYNITKNFSWNSKTADLIFRMTAKYGTPYFQNFISSDLDPHAIRSMCCHLRLDLTQLKFRRMGGFFGFADKTGSVGVVTINLPRIGYLAKDETDFFRRLAKVMDLAKESLEIKRSLVLQNMESGLFPFTKIYLGSLKTHFSTIGLIGMEECCQNFLKRSIATKEGKDFALKTLEFMRDRIIGYQKATGHLFNLEATPAEGCTYRLAMLDKKKYPKMKTAGHKEPYYTNSTWLPVGHTKDPFDALDHQEALQVLYNGGTIFHTFIGERIQAPETKRLVKKILQNYKVPYITITPTFSICPEHGYIAGEHFKCEKCGLEADVYSRVVGFLRPVQDWNKGKKEEFRDRLEYQPQKG